MGVKVGFIGAGFITGLHTGLLADCGVEHQVVAVHDPKPEKAAALAAVHGARVLGRDELLAEVDAVYVTTWAMAHEELVAAAAEAGVAVFCEKPLAIASDAVDRMIATVERAGVVNQVGLILRSLPAFVLAKSLLADVRAGRLMAAVARGDQFLPTQGQYASTWRVDRNKAGRGSVLEHGIHDVDIVRWICGPVSSLDASLREMHGHPGIDDIAVARFDFASGALGSFVSVWHDNLSRPSTRLMEFFSESLYLAIDEEDGGGLSWQFSGEKLVRLAGVDLMERARALPEANGRRVSVLQNVPVFNTATDFLSAVRDGRPSPIPFEAARPAHRLVDAIYRSAETGARVDDPESASVTT